MGYDVRDLIRYFVFGTAVFLVIGGFPILNPDSYIRTQASWQSILLFYVGGSCFFGAILAVIFFVFSKRDG